MEREIRKTSFGFYSTNKFRTQFADPRPITRLAKNDYGDFSEYKVPIDVFLIPSESDTGPLETEWFRGGLTHPNRMDFGLSKKDWDIRVVRALEPHRPSINFTGKLIFHFHRGRIQQVLQ